MRNSKLILSLVRRDFKTSKASISIKFSIFFVIFSLLTMLTIYKVYDFQIINSKSIILELFKGCDFLQFSGKVVVSGFQFPFSWLLINTFIIYALGDYFYKDIKENGKYLLIRVKKMKLIYIAKIIWSITMINLYYCILIIIAGVLGALFSNGSYEYMNPNYLKISTFNLIGYIFVLYTLTTISLVIFFITLTMKVKPVYSFLIVVVLYTSSLFVDSKLFIGQHSLLIRHVPFNYIHNFTLVDSIIFNLVFSILFFFVGAILSSKKEVF